MLPLAPDLSVREHAPAAAHVVEGSLDGTVGAAALDMGNTRHRVGDTPGLRRGLVTGAVRDGVGLALVA